MTMIEAAARAVHDTINAGFPSEGIVDPLDREIVLAVLDAIQEPSQAMMAAAPRANLATVYGQLYVWRAMVAALIAEREGGNR